MSLHPLAAVGVRNDLGQFMDGGCKKHGEMQTSDDELNENEGDDTNSVGYEDKSTQTEPIVVGESWQAVKQSSDSLPDLPNYEISQIISDAIDNLPPGSLLPLEESRFAPGSKRNLEYRAELKTKMASPRMTSNGKAKVSGSNESQRSAEDSRADQSGFAFSNRFSSLAGPEKPETVSRVTSKTLIGPGLYARSARSVPKNKDSESVKGQIHTYSPAPGVVLKYESVEKPSKSGPNGAEKPGVSTSNQLPTLHHLTETKNSSQNPQLPPHLRIGQSLDPVKSEKSSDSESIQVTGSKASHLDAPAVRETTLHSISATKSAKVEEEITLHSASTIKSIKVEEESASSSRFPVTSTIKSVKVEGEGCSSSRSSKISAVKSVAFEGNDPSSPRLIKENRSNELSPTVEKLPPHLRKTEPQSQPRDLHHSVTKSQESASSPPSSREKLAPHEKGQIPITQEVLPVFNKIDTPPNVSTISTFSSPENLTRHEKGKILVTQQLLPVIDTDATSNASTTSAFSSLNKMTLHEKSESAAPPHTLPALKTDAGFNLSTTSAFQSPDKMTSREKSKSPDPQHTVPISVASPNKASGASSSEDVGPNLKDALYFKAWPKSEPRDTPAAEVRKIIIKNLPSNATPSFVTSIVNGGALERIDVKGGIAHVLFLHAKDCQKFYDATANGLVYSFESRKGIAHVDKAADVDVLSGQARTFIELGFTRCVRATGIGSDLTVEKLRDKAAYRNRIVEDVVIGINESGLRFTIIRFCDIRHAVQFKHALDREEEWEDCNIHFSPDPCA